jgi:hypothetical protein
MSSDIYKTEEGLDEEGHVPLNVLHRELSLTLSDVQLEHYNSCDLCRFSREVHEMASDN